MIKKVKNIVFNKYRYSKIKKVIPNDTYAEVIAKNWVDYDWLEWDESKKLLRVKNTNIEITENNCFFLLSKDSAFKNLVQLQQEAGAKYFQENNQLYIQINGLTLNIQTTQEIYTLDEIYLGGFYHFAFNRDFIAIDIGMNVGYSSLYFAIHPLCKKVFSFEPFKPTYAQGRHNIDNNPAAAVKIQTYNYALSDKNDTIEIDYSPSIRGSMSIDYWPDFANKSVEEVVKEKIVIRDVEEAFTELNLPQDKNNMVIAKIDCEGAEYAIVDKLLETGRLQHIDVIMMEWHLKGTDLLTIPLNKAGFECFCINQLGHEGKYGFIYAINKRK
ncbi:MAG: FkbM family methyltransferase [Ferruginibacter sp.]